MLRPDGGWVGFFTWTAESPMNNIEVFHFVQIRGQ